EGAARPARVRAHVEQRLAGAKLDALQEALELALLAAPVGDVLVREVEDPLAIPAVGAHGVGEALEPRGLAAHDVRRFGHQIDHAARDRGNLVARAAHERAASHLPLALASLRGLDLEEPLGAAAR